MKRATRHTPRSAFRTPHSRRRGVLLIIVLSLLVMFALIGFTFVLVAGHYDRAARAGAKAGLTDDQGQELVEAGFLDLLRGSNNLRSRINDVDNLANPTFIAQSHCLLEDEYGPPVLAKLQGPSFPGFGASGNEYWRFNAVPMPGYTLDLHTNGYTGQVLTMLEGEAALRSGRILMMRPIPGGRVQVYVEFFDPDSGLIAQPSNEPVFLINGRPFGGDGVNTANESWDAPDAANPFLAFIPANATTTSQIIPSFADRLFLDTDGDGDFREVDNDRDGLEDSGWIDLGQEIKTARDGRRYKPYYAILCIDLDGRLNLNAHGNFGQLATINPNYAAAHSGRVAGNAAPSRPRGMGYGPAGVNLSALFSGNASKYEALLTARYASPGESPAGPGRGGVEDQWLLAAQELPNAYGAAAPVGYASHPDSVDGGLMVVDHAGRPSPFNMGIANELSASPYQLNLVAPNGKDNPYTAAEQERLLRWNDTDREALPRLWDRHSALTMADFQSLVVRRSLTTHSAHAPVAAGPARAVEMMGNRLSSTLGPTFGVPTINEVRNLVPFEIQHGAKMNVNRLWGNNIDDNANGVIDEPAELASETLMTNIAAYGGSGVAGNYHNNAPDTTDKRMGRWLYARHLYCLMMLVSDPAYKQPLGTNNPENLSDAQRREAAIRRIAQWAVNCVDFRDPDAIMTPFEYDAEPFNGWDVDGDLATVETDPANSANPHPDRRVVWGMEYPDLMFTESLSMHDRAVRDTNYDDHSDPADEDAESDTAINKRGTKRIHTQYLTLATKKGDKDLDQVRIPEGSTFLELYCPRNTAANNPVLPRELYVPDSLDGNKLKLDLDKMVGNSPVWRVAISKPHHTVGDGAGRNALSPLVRRGSNPDTVTFEPSELSVGGDDPIERYLWFTSAPPAAAAAGETAANTFYIDDLDAALLEPGRYCLVGPRTKTYIGGKPISDGASAKAETAKGDQLIDLGAGAGIGVDYKGLDGLSNYPLSPALPTNINPPLALNAVIDSPGYPHKRGLNISEPLPTASNKYPVPTHDADGDGITDAYGNSLVDSEVSPTARYRDTPLDSETTPNRPLKAGAILQTQTVDNYRTAYLQRLANPMLAWNPAPPHANHDSTKAVNPYLTIDWIPLDLQVFNGEDRAADDWSTRPGANATKSADFDTDDDGSGTITFASRQRQTPSAAAATNNIWTPAGQVGAGLGATTGLTSDECFRHALGAPNNPMMTIGYVNLPYTPQGGAAKGDPDAPFPWLMWPNRPFVSHYELMLVPAASPSRLMSELTRARTSVNPYTDQTGLFGHLLNFYQHSGTPGEAGHFYRVLDYLEVPSRFAGAQNWLSRNSGFVIWDMYSPYHRQSRFRDPGLVNINTVVGSGVWEAIENNGNSGAAFVTYADLDNSRRGTPDSFGRFGNAFRGEITDSDGASVTASDVQRGLLRGGNLPLIGPPQSTASYNDPNQHAYFRMQGLQRLGNTITTRSNVFAIWITVGYFEVDGDGNLGAPPRELGSDTGEITRHRGFYMVDRSIPVAYQRGRNHNVDRCVLVRRYLE